MTNIVRCKKISHLDKLPRCTTHHHSPHNNPLGGPFYFFIILFFRSWKLIILAAYEQAVLSQSTKRFYIHIKNTAVQQTHKENLSTKFILLIDIVTPMICRYFWYIYFWFEISVKNNDHESQFEITNWLKIGNPQNP